MYHKKKYSILVTVLTAYGLALCPIPGLAQSGLPQLEEVYGGRVNGIASAPLDETHTRILVSAESANSLFYGDLDHSLQDPFSSESFQFRVVPDFDANANFGVLNAIAVHRSGKIFVGHDTGLYSCDTAPDTRSKLRDRAVQSLLIRGDTLIGVEGQAVFRVELSSEGEATGFSGPFEMGFPSPFFGEMAVHPVNRKLYVLDATSGSLIKSSQDFDTIDLENTFSIIQTPGIFPNGFIRFGIGPDGRLFLAASTTMNNGKMIYYSDDDGESWQTVETGVSGVVGQLAFMGPAEAYMVLCGSALSIQKGEVGSWTRLPRGGHEDSHLNDGAACADPNNPNTFYFTTDAGFGATLNGGVDIQDVVQGLTAVQINDFDMNSDKTVAWTASKSGIRIATGFPDAPTWSRALFPNFDGAPYFSVAVDRADPSGMTAYVGNCRIYKTEDGGQNWTLKASFDEPSFSAIVSSLEAAGDLVLAGLFFRSPGELGGLLVSHDAGENFTWVLLGRDTDGVNVNDILLTEEGGNPVAYIAAAADPGAITGGGHVYRFVPGVGAEKIELDEGMISIRSLAKTPEGGIYACGMTDTFSPALYYKAPESEEWVSLPTNGLPSDVRPLGPNPQWRGPVMAVGFDSMEQPVPIVAIGVRLYYLPVDSEEWFTSPEMEYPRGTQLNVLFWDELMVGTDIGLFSHETVLDMPEVESELEAVAADFDGDKRCDLAAEDLDGNWYFWLSRVGYRLFGPARFSAAGLPGAGDFDGDGRADPFVLREDGKAVAFLSGGLYRLSVIFSTEERGFPVVADFDGDHRADVAIVDELDGTWKQWLSSQRYSEPVPLRGVGGKGEPTAGDFDGDGRADPVLADDETGVLTLWPSKFAYMRRVGPIDFDMTGAVLAGDFDRDGIADFADLREDGSLYLRLSRSRWAFFVPISLPMPEE